MVIKRSTFAAFRAGKKQAIKATAINMTATDTMLEKYLNRGCRKDDRSKPGKYHHRAIAVRFRDSTDRIRAISTA
jgi:hypothetical protein